MTKYIDADKAINELADMHCKSDEDGYVWIIRSDAWARIDAIPSADVRENVHGEWIEPKGVLTSLCSECGFINNSAKWNFCPNCGCSMKGEYDG